MSCRHDSSTINCKRKYTYKTKMKMIITARLQELPPNKNFWLRTRNKVSKRYEFMGFPFWFQYYYLQYILQNNVLWRIGTMKWNHFWTYTYSYNNRLKDLICDSQNLVVLFCSVSKVILTKVIFKACLPLQSFRATLTHQ